MPDCVVAALRDNIKTIEDIALKEGIYLEPVKELKFVKPNTNGADFIPLQANDCEKESHHVTNIFPKDNDVIYVSKNKSINEDDEVVFVKTVQYEPGYISDELIEVTSSDYDSKILLDDEIDTKPTPKKARAHAAMDPIIDTDIKTSKSDIRSCYNLEYDTVSSTVADSDSVVDCHLDACMKMKTDIEPVAGCSTTTLNDIILPKDNNEQIESSTSDIRPNYKLKKDTVSSIDSDSMANKEMKAKIEPVTGCSTTTLNDVIVLDDNDEDIKSSTFDIGLNNKQRKDTVPSIDCDSVANKKMKAKIEPVAGCSTTSSNDVIMLDDNDEDIKLVESDNASESNTFAASLLRQVDSNTEQNDYKYGYEDIVTGTFEDKLEESLAKGIDINIKNGITDELNRTLLDDYNIMVKKPKYLEMKRFREILPTYKMAKELIEVVNNNQVVVISGETGCGKSTQVSFSRQSIEWRGGRQGKSRWS